MKKIIFSLITLSWLICVVTNIAYAADNAIDLEQLRRLQQMADQQIQKARQAEDKQRQTQQQQPVLRPRPQQPSGPTLDLSNRAQQPIQVQTNVPAQGQVGGQAQAGMPMPQGPELSDEEKISRLAFKQMLEQLFPLSPEQIVALRKKYNETELAKTVTSQTPPKPVATSQFVNLSPGSSPPIVRLSKGFVTSLVFLDSSGAQWPIEAYDLGDPRTFNIQWDRTSNVMMIQAMQQYNYGNLAIRLRGLNTPVMITLIPGQKAVDYRIDMRVQGYGPNAHVPTGDMLPPSVHKELLGLLDGVPPTDSRELEVVGGAAQAWMRGSTLFLRTRHQVISPGWFATLRSADGMHVYRLAKTPLVLVTQHGRIKRLKIEGL